jgi:sulfate transport system ATP-binding protein
VTSIFVTHDQEEALEVADRVVLMNAGKVEQIGSPQEVWDHPASPFVYGFLGDVNLFHGRVEGTEVVIGSEHHSVRIDSPEHQHAQDAKALAYVRPHDIEVQPYVETTSAPSQGLVAQLTRAIVVGPTARLELVRWRDSDASVIEVQIPASQYQSLGLKEGQLLVLTPKRARVFVEGSSPLVTAPSSQSPSPS